MKKLKIPVRKRRTAKIDSENEILETKFRPNKYLKIAIYSSIILLPVIFAYVYLRFSFSSNKLYSFPLDDPWIHLTFAKNLAEYFSFSYFKNEMVTAGSTSPLYTFFAAIGFLFSKNEMAISYALGILFFSLSAVAFYKLSLFEFDNEGVFALLCTGIFIIDKWINFISVSGMETTMFIFILVLCAYFYKKRNPVPFAVTFGLIIWARPDGIVFIIAVLIDYILVLIYSKRLSDSMLFSKKDLMKITFIFLGIVGLYFFMNYKISGTILPNTFAAKLAYYTPEFRSRFGFLKDEVWEYFRSGSYYLLMFGFIFSFLKLIYDISKKNYNQNTLYILFALGLILIYLIKLPYAHRFGRYMMPIIPFFILVATIGFRDIARLINKYTNNKLFSKSIFYILIVVTYFIGIKNYDEVKSLYSSQCKYIYDRQVKAAYWIRDNTKENDVIATHDIGAIGYYGNRKIVDVVGLVTPEVIPKVLDPTYADFIIKFMKEKGVTYMVFMKEWNRVSNQNALYSSTEPVSPEVMQVYKFYPDKTHLLSLEANSLLLNAGSLVSQKAGQQLIFITNRVIELEPNSSYAYYLKSYGYYALKDYDNYEKTLLKALEIFPDFIEAHQNLGIHYYNSKRLEEAKMHLTKVLEFDPDNVVATNYLYGVNDLLIKQKEQIPEKK